MTCNTIKITVLSRILYLLGLLVVMVTGVGCEQVRPMALSEQDGKLVPGQDAIILITVRTSNAVNPSVTPEAFVVYVPQGVPGASGVVSKTPRGTQEAAGWEIGKAITHVDKQYNEYILSLRVSGNKLALASLQTYNSTPFVFTAVGFIPLDMSLPVEPGHVYYAGRIEANVRPREGNELRAGHVVPLIDQEAAGYSSGTWDVVVVDNFAQDLATIKKHYPAVGDVNIEKRILPAWVRPKG
jgi:hypothetical protein